MDIYNKPYINDIFENRHRECYYPYPDELFKKYDIFPLFVLDGGAFFFIKDRIGGEAVSQTILNAYTEGKLFELWSHEGRFDWELAFKLTSKSMLPNSIEWVVWLNRLYYLLPLAQMFFRTGDEKWAEEWCRNFGQWVKIFKPFYVKLTMKEIRIHIFCKGIANIT